MELAQAQSKQITLTPMKHKYLPLAATILLSSCSYTYTTCNLQELVTPPDARVAMVDGYFPKRSFVLYGGVGPRLYKWNNVLYQKRVISYAVANRPIIRREDAPWATWLTPEETKEQFTIDSTIPEEVWMQPVGTWEEACSGNPYACIPASQFDFAEAKEVTYHRVDAPERLITLCDLPLQDKAGTETAWRNIVGFPLGMIDFTANASFFVVESGLLLSGAIIALPFAPFVNMQQQEEPTQPVEN